MAEQNTKQSPAGNALDVQVEQGGMTLYAVRDSAVGIDQLRVRELLKALDQQHVEVTDDIRQRIAEVFDGWKSGTIEDDRVLLVEGRPAQHGRDGRLEWAPECDPEQLKQQSQEQGEFSHYRSRLISVETGQVIATLKRATPGKPGKNIFGQPLDARDGKPYEPKLVAGCHLDADDQIIADQAGTLIVNGDDIRIEEDLQIAGNVDFETGHVHTHGNLSIQGGVADLFQVYAGKNIEIHNSVESAEIRSRGDVTCHDHVANKLKGIVLAGGSIDARLIDNSLLAARGDIRVGKEAIAGHLFAGGKVVCETGVLSGGVIVGRNGVEAKVLGSGGRTHMIVVAGIDWMLEGEVAPMIAKIKELSKTIDQRQPQIDTLKANMKRLTAQQREQVTELEFQLYEIVSERDELTETIQKRREESASQCAVQIQVTSQVHPGVELRLGAMKTIIDSPIKGPATIVLTEVLDEPVVVAITGAGRKQTLRSKELTNPLQGIDLPEMPPQPFAGYGKP